MLALIKSIFSWSISQMASQNNSQAKKNAFNPFENASSVFPNFMEQDNVRDEMSKNVAAMTAANQVAMQCMRETARRSMEVFQKNAQSMYECSKDAASCNNLQEAHSRSADMLSFVMQNYFGHAQEAAKMASSAAQEIVDICNKRMSEALDRVANNQK
jgi:hypothetical protein